MEVYAAYFDNAVRKKSSSGAIFSVLSAKFDVVYGVAFSDDCYDAVYVREERNISRIIGSKYIQAKVGNTFKSVKQDLEKEKKVLFSGTGCQINGLKCFLQKDYPNLFLLDVICHGVPSPKLWKEYIKYQEKRLGKVEQVNFRSKKYGWSNYGIEINDKYIPKEKDAYMRMFIDNISLRPSCYECHVKNYKCSDITIGDFWGISAIDKSMYNEMGTSLVIVRTKKGKELFENMKSDLKLKRVTYEEGVRYNSAEYTSAQRPKERENFFDDLSKVSFEELEQKYVRRIKISAKERGKRVLKKYLRIIKEKY